MSTTVKLADLMQNLLECSEKAACIARSIRSDERLFRFLIQEKAEGEKNPKFKHDFKTLADVLIQEMIKHEISEVYGYKAIGEHIYGEENGNFTTSQGETIHLAIQGDEASTQATLSRILNGDTETASILANLVHVKKELPKEPGLEACTCSLPIDRIGIWIDPIDGTSQYIGGKIGDTDPQTGIYVNGGVQCSTVLVGLFDRTSSQPIAGVINQPFFTQSKYSWVGRHLWGISYNGCNINNLQGTSVTNPSDRIITRFSEPKWVRHSFGSRCSFAPAAGYKILLVLDGLGVAYVSGTGNLYMWDTCGPHAILRSIGGGIAVLKSAISTDVSSLTDQNGNVTVEAKYIDADTTHSPSEKYAHSHGVICYRSKEDLIDIVQRLKLNYRPRT